MVDVSNGPAFSFAPFFLSLFIITVCGVAIRWRGSLHLLSLSYYVVVFARRVVLPRAYNIVSLDEDLNSAVHKRIEVTAGINDYLISRRIKLSIGVSAVHLALSLGRCYVYLLHFY